MRSALSTDISSGSTAFLDLPLVTNTNTTTYTTSTNTLTINSDGKYHIDYTLYLEPQTTSTVTKYDFIAEIYIGPFGAGTPILDSITIDEDLYDAGDVFTLSTSLNREFSAGDQIRLFVNHVGGPGSMRVLLESFMTVHTLMGCVGPTGPTGSSDVGFAFYANIATGAFTGLTGTEITWDSGAIIESNGAVASLSSGRISLDIEGTYLLEINVAYEKLSVGFAGIRSTIQTDLSDDGGTTRLVNSEAITYHRNGTDGFGSNSITYVYDNTSPPTTISIWVIKLTATAGLGTQQQYIPIEGAYRAYVSLIVDNS